jgi:hypothetical protein
VIQRAVVGEQQESRRVAIQSTNGGHHGCACEEPLRQERIHQVAAILRGADIARGFVQEQHTPGRRVEGHTVDADLVVRRDVAIPQHAAIGGGHPSTRQHPLDRSPAAVAQIREILRKLHTMVPMKNRGSPRALTRCEPR